MSNLAAKLQNVGAKVKQMGQQVKERVGVHSGLPEHLPHLDVESNAVYRHYLMLGMMMGHLEHLARTVTAHLHTAYTANAELAAFMHNQTTGETRDFFDIQKITERFQALNNVISQSYITALVQQIDNELLVPFQQERQKDEETKRLIETASSERLIDFVLTRNEKRAVLLAQGMLALINSQAVFTRAAFESFGDLSESLLPAIQQLKARDSPKKPAPSIPTKQATPVAPTKTATPVVPTKASVPVTPMPASQPFSEDLLGMDFTTPAQPQVTPTQPQPPQDAKNTLFSFDDDPPSTFGSSQSSPGINHDPFGLHESSWTQPSTPIMTPSPVMHHTDPFADVFGATLTPQQSTIMPQAQQNPTVVTNGVHPSFYNDHEDEKPKVKPIRKALPEEKYDEKSVQNRIEEKIGAMHARDAEHEQEMAKRREMDTEISMKIERWSGGRKGNLRALLSTLHLIMWEGSGWKEISIASLVTPDQLKLAYRKALIIVHPDKLKNKTLEQRFLSERIFELLNEAYKNEESLQ